MAADCYCDDMSYRKCVHCQEAEDREEEHEVCSGWNWNNTPRECALEARELGWSAHRLRSAMLVFGFSEDLAGNVLYEFEVGE